MQGFKEFIIRGNLIEMAVAFIMGAAFNGVVDSFTNIIMSVISAILGGPPNFDAWQPAGLPLGAFLTQAISFLLIATILYFGLVLPISKLRKHEEAEDELSATETELLSEIRDILARNNPAPEAGSQS